VVGGLVIVPDTDILYPFMEEFGYDNLRESLFVTQDYLRADHAFVIARAEVDC
jgi:hypothetical protein